MQLKSITLIILTTICCSSLQAQKHCKCQIDKIEKKQDGDNGIHDDVSKGLSQRPVTTFSRGSDNKWFNPSSFKSSEGWLKRINEFLVSPDTVYFPKL